jgi:DnaK suppressor protein
MEPDELEEFRNNLVRRRNELIAEGDIAIEPKKGEADHKPDDDEAPLTEMNQVIASKRNKARALELQRIESALQRLDEDPDEFGYCFDCEEPIDPRRLAVMPWALRCVQCADARAPKRGGRRRHLADYD